ncbi:nucleotidyltransferase domain-containing protein [Propionivibrio sp.]|uniref:nucleotidyltransferase domain-containing protein n=1 Tax=Propionivibrio sp. TaxID=2212460 RepID=UPI003BF0368B
MSIEATILNRINDRLLACRESASQVVAALKDVGVEAVPFGSTLRGDVHTDSDLDILVLDCDGVPRGVVMEIAERASSVAVDVLFAEDVKPEVLNLIEQEIRRGDQIC